MMPFFFNYQILSNSVERLLIFILILLLAVLFNIYVSKLLGSLIYRLFRRFTQESHASKFHFLVLRPMQYLVVIIIVIAGLETLNFPEVWKIKILGHDLQNVASKFSWLVLLISFTWVLLRIVDFLTFILRDHAARTESKIDDQLIPFLKDTLKAVIFISAALTILGFVFGLNITSLLAGVGLGGLAIAFAAQESIKDFFGAVTILVDKPFTVGDAVRVGDASGTVERVGIRSTRIRTADKSLLTVPNKKMIETSVENISSSTLRRVNLTIGITYETKPEALKKILSDLRNYFKSPEFIEAEHYVIFDSYGESSLNIRIEYFTPYLPWLEFLQKKEEVNFKIMEVVSLNGGAFAYPVRDVRIDQKIFRENK